MQVSEQDTTALCGAHETCGPGLADGSRHAASPGTHWPGGPSRGWLALPAAVREEPGAVAWLRR